MTHRVYVAARDAAATKAAITLGLVESLAGRVETVGVFRPVVREGRPDQLIETVRSRFEVLSPYEDCAGVTYSEVHADAEAAIGVIVGRYRRLALRYRAIVIIGTDHTGVGVPGEYAFNARLAANLAAPVLTVVNGLHRSDAELASALADSHTELAKAHATELAVAVTRADPDRLPEISQQLGSHPAPVFVLPEVARLTAPTVGDLMAGCDGQLVLGDSRQLGREVGGLTVAETSLPVVLDRMTDGAAILVPAERAGEILPGLLAAHHAATFPALSAIVLTGDPQLPESLWRLLTGLDVHLPIIRTELDTFVAAARLSRVEGRFTPAATGKIETAIGLFTAHVDSGVLTRRLKVTRPTVVTPHMFEYDLLERARSAHRHIVLPEGGEERVLRAADILLRRGVAALSLVGEEMAVRSMAAELGLDIAAAQVLDPFDEELRERFAKEYAALRAHKGMTHELARDSVTDVSCFGTMLVHLGLVDGMVSGAVHTTAHTIRPAFEIIKAAPGASVVSSVFFMCLPDRVLVFGDCAVNPDPTAAQLADIAISSAATAAHFGVAVRIAMLSYSTGASGGGTDVDKVRAATELVRRRRPDLPVEGPLQYDAAVDPGVARAKLPGSAVAGRCTVFVVPDLNTGNVLYKAVQRSAGATAIGPVLQGLRKPVNDLSRGATVHDIVNAVAITAVQAGQGLPSAG